MREKPEHIKPSFHSKHSDHTTHRCFYIDGKCQFAFFVDKETDIKVILDKFLKEKDFISLKQHFPEWAHIGLQDYFPETNEVFLTTNKKAKNLVDDKVTIKSLAKEKKKADKQAKKMAELEEGVSVTAGGGTIENFEKKIKQQGSKNKVRSLI